MSGEVNFGGTATPAAGHNTFPIANDIDLFNGARVVANNAARNAINSQLITAGALVLVVDSDGLGTFGAYRYLGTDPTSNSNWTTFASGSGGGVKWTPANATDRNAITVAALDVNSLAWQVDEQSLWIATAAGTGSSVWKEILVTPAQIGAVPTTRQVIAGTGLSGGGALSADRTLAVSYGTTSGTAVQGNDSRVTSAVANTRQVLSGTGLSGGGDLSADRTLAVVFGTTAGTVVQGNDSRFLSSTPSTRRIDSGTGLTGGGDLSADRTLAVSYGTTAGTAAQGNDSRITGAVQTTRQVIAGTGLTGGGDLSADRTFAVSYGTTAGTAVQGNDTRVTGAVPNTRQVLAGTGLTGGGDLSADRTLTVSYGTTAGTAAQGNDARITGAVQNTRQVLAGTGLSGGGDLSADRTLSVTFGTTAGTVMQGNDSRVTGGVPSTRQVATGNGLSGGGDLSADRTLTVNADSTLAFSTGVLGVSQATATPAALGTAAVGTGSKSAREDHVHSNFTTTAIYAGTTAAINSEQAGAHVAVSTATGTFRGFIGYQISTGTTSSKIILAKARGAVGGLLTAAASDVVANFSGAVYDGTSWLEAASIRMTVDSAVSTGVTPVSMGLYTGSGSSPTLRLLISSAGVCDFQSNQVNTGTLYAGTTVTNTEQAGSLVSASTGSTAKRGVISWQYSTDTNGSRHIGAKARGTQASPTTVASGDNVTRLVGSAYDGTSWLDSAYISLDVDAAVSTGVAPQGLNFYTGTTSTPTLRLSISSAGAINFQANRAQNIANATASTDAVALGQLQTYVRTGRTTAVSSSPFTILTTHEILLVDTSAARTLNLPSPSSGNVFIIKDATGNSQTNAMTLHRNGSETIEGASADFPMSAYRGSWMVVSDGTNWFVFGVI